MHLGVPWNQFVLEATRNKFKGVSAFANTEGGALYFGVSNNGTVTGLKDIQADSDFISEKINAHLDPLPEWTLTPAEGENGNKILELMVKPGQFTPASEPCAQGNEPQLGCPTFQRKYLQAQFQDACERIP